jgi:hypothetical protein
MRIYTKRLLVRGEKMRIITKVEGILGRDDLPEQYFKNEFFYFNRDFSHPCIVIGKISYSHGYCEEDVCKTFFPIAFSEIGRQWGNMANIPEERFQALLSHIRKAIKNLIRIKKSLPIWNGEETFIL